MGYIFNTYGGMAEDSSPISGWLHLADDQFLRRPLGAPTLEIHHGKHQQNWAKIDILGVDNNLVPLQE